MINQEKVIIYFQDVRYNSIQVAYLDGDPNLSNFGVRLAVLNYGKGLVVVANLIKILSYIHFDRDGDNDFIDIGQDNQVNIDVKIGLVLYVNGNVYNVLNEVGV